MRKSAWIVRIALTVSVVATLAAPFGCQPRAVSGAPELDVSNPAATLDVQSAAATPLAARSTASAVPMPQLTYGKVKYPGSGAYVGVFHPPAPFGFASYDTFQNRSAKDPAIVMWYQPWEGSSAFDAAACESVLKRGGVPMITWEPWNPAGDPKKLTKPANQPKYALRHIIAGDFDAYIRTWARGVKSVNGPVMIRFAHEMNGNWYPWCGTVNGNTPAQYRAAYRHVVGVFRQEGVKNVTWVWTINGVNYPHTAANVYSAYYPGDAYVDWVGTSGFNWGTSRKGFPWQSFDKLYAAPLGYLGKLKKPIVLAEMASTSSGGSKAAWITDAYYKIRTKYRRVKAVVWYNTKDVRLDSTQDWRIDSSPTSRRAYEKATGFSYYYGSPVALRRSWKR